MGVLLLSVMLFMLTYTTLYSMNIHNFLVVFFIIEYIYYLQITTLLSSLLITQIGLKHPMTTRMEGLHFCDCHMHSWSRIFLRKTKIYFAITFFTWFCRPMSLLELCLSSLQIITLLINFSFNFNALCC